MSDRGRTGEPSHLPLHLLLVLMVIVTIYPILWVFTVAFSGEQSLSIVDLPPDPTFWDRARAVIPWPKTLSMSNFTAVFTEQPFARWLLNSAVVAAATTVLGVALACTAAYAFSRFKFPGRRAGLMAFLVSQMFPGVLMLIPLYIIIVKWLGLGSSWLALILVYTMTAIPFCVWMLKGYFDTIPRELEESALIDGASPARVFFQIVLPLARAGDRGHRPLLVHDRVERVHPGGDLHGQGDDVHRAGRTAVLRRRFPAAVGLLLGRGDRHRDPGRRAVPFPSAVPGFRPDGRGGQGLTASTTGGRT